jgi:FixJ family two-component response regulator
VTDRSYISVIDDDGSFPEAIASLVELLGYRVVAFSSRKRFLASPAVERAWCAITDI